MHKPLLAPVIYGRLYPIPKSTDPPNFQVHISKQLVPEVRAETARFYGHIDCIEAQYPGLDYALAAHRLRLSRFPYHRRLFQASINSDSPMLRSKRSANGKELAGRGNGTKRIQNPGSVIPPGRVWLRPDRKRPPSLGQAYVESTTPDK